MRAPLWSILIIFYHVLEFEKRMCKHCLILKREEEEGIHVMTYDTWFEVLLPACFALIFAVSWPCRISSCLDLSYLS